MMTLLIKESDLCVTTRDQPPGSAERFAPRRSVTDLTYKSRKILESGASVAAGVESEVVVRRARFLRPGSFF